MNERLVVDDREYRIYKYRITWYLIDEQDYGGSLDPRFSSCDLKKIPNTENREMIVACKAAMKSSDVRRDGYGYYWETMTAARAALRAVRHALKIDGGPSWPEWAIKAIAAGWRAPKSWKP